MSSYSSSFKERMVSRMSGPNAISAHALAGEVGIGQPTLSRWLREAARVPSMAKKKSTRRERRLAHGKRRPSQWSPEEKYRVVLASAACSDATLGELLRREGLHESDLERFREEVRAAAVGGLAASKRASKGPSEEQRRIKELERELKRKEAALAETAAVLVLRKKAVALWGEEGEDI